VHPGNNNQVGIISIALALKIKADLFRELHPGAPNETVIISNSNLSLSQNATLCISQKFAQYYFQTKHKATTKQRRIGPWKLYVEEEPPWVFDQVLDAAQEVDGLSAIDQPVVVCQRKVHHGPREDAAIHDHGALHNGMHPKNR